MTGAARTLWRGRAARVLLVAAVLAPLAIVASQSAEAVTSKQLKAQISKLNHQIEDVSQDYQATRDKIDSLNVSAKAANQRAASATTRLTQARTTLAQIAAELYRDGSLGSLTLVLGDDPGDALAQTGLATTVAERKAQAIATFTSAQKDQREARADYASQMKSLKTLEAKQKKRLKELNAKSKLVKARLALLTAPQRESISGNSVSAGLSCAAAGVDIPSGSAGKAVAYACAQIGDPYVWGADGPSTFDCSGLTMAAWAKGGVSLPHNANDQSHRGTRVSLSSVSPGDLLMYRYSGGRYRHVAMYVGNGYAIHAPQTGDVVRLFKVSERTPAAVVHL